MKPEQPYRILVVDDDKALHGVFSAMLGSASQIRDPKKKANGNGNAIGNGTGTGNGNGNGNGHAHGQGKSPLMGVPEQQPFPTFEIDFAYQGQDGLERVRKALAERRPYTMAFVDMRMPPGWNGIETISHIWKECFDLQVVICTGHADFSWHDLIRQFGHSDRLLVLKKPFDMTEVRQVAYSLAEKWDLAHQALGHLQRLQKLVSERTASLQEANLSLQRKIVENKQAERRLLTQHSVTQTLAQATNLDSAVEIIFQIVCRSLDWEWGGMWQVDSQANVLRLARHWHGADEILEAFSTLSCDMSLEPGNSVAGRVWSSGQPVWMRDIFLDGQTARARAASDHGFHGVIAFPICAGTKLFGVMEFLSREIRERDKDMLQTFTVIGSAIGQYLERRQAVEDLKRERDYVDQIIRETPALVVGIAPDGTTTFVNPSAARHTGYTEGELIGKNWWQLLYQGKEFQQVEQLFRDIEKGPVRDYEMVLRTKDGLTRTVSWNSLSKFDENGRLAELIGFGNDITERKRAEVERGMMEMQLRHAQKMESIGHLAAGIAHEINTPTQYLGDNIRFLQTSFLDLKGLHARYEQVLQAARENALTPELLGKMEENLKHANVEFLMKEIPDAIEQSLEGVARVTRIVRAMKDFSHPGTGEKTPIDLNKAVETTLTVAGNEWKYVAKIETDFAPDLPLVPCFPGELNQVILNLVVNAAHAIADVVGNGSHGMGVIRAGTKRNGDWAEVRIRDTGTGIPEKIHSKIFDPFFTTKPVGKGSGQGLAISHAVIVDMHQGQLTFETEMGAGTEFIIRLPLHPPPRAKEELRP
jgi:PAS domain S-box-containing protein